MTLNLTQNQHNQSMMNQSMNQSHDHSMMEPDETMTVSRIEELKKAHKFPGVKPYTVDTDPSD